MQALARLCGGYGYALLLDILTQLPLRIPLSSFAYQIKNALVPLMAFPVHPSTLSRPREAIDHSCLSSVRRVAL